MKKLAVISSILFLLGSNALHAGIGGVRGPASAGEDMVNRYRGRIQEAMNEVRALQPACPDCGLYTESTDEEESLSPACRQTYQRIFKVKPRARDESPSDRLINVRVAFGYMDSTIPNTTEDRYASFAFAAELLNACRPGGFACGFQQSPDDAEVFTKKISVLGPDGLPRERTVNVRIRCSSVTDNEKENLGERAEDQKDLSDSTTQFFSDGLKNSDIVFYVGHARDGGGPDFSPPVLNTKTGHPDYPWYHVHHPGTDMMTEALSESTHAPKVLGIFACYAEDHFGDWLRTLTPHTGLILSGQQDFEASVGQASASLDSIMGLRCEDQFNQAIDVLKKVNGAVITPVHLDNLFAPRD